MSDKQAALEATDSKVADPKGAVEKPADPKAADPKPSSESKASDGKDAPKEAGKDAAKPEAKPLTTKAEEEGVKAILAQIKAELGSSLKDLASPFTPRDLSTYAANAMAAPATGTRPSIDRLTLIDQVLLNGTFPVALTLTNGNISRVRSSVSIREAFRKLGAEDRRAISAYFLEQRLASFSNAGNTYVQAFESEALAKLYKSEAMHMAFDASGKAIIKGVTFGGSTSYARQTSSEHQSQALQRELHVSMVREEAVLELRLPPSLIEVPADRQNLYASLIADYEAAETALPQNNREAARSDLRLELLAKVQQKGFLVPTRYLLGGRLTSETTETTTESLEASAKIVRQQFAAMLSAEAPLVGGGKAGGGVGSASSDSQTRSKAAHGHGFLLESVGGDSTLAAKPQEWVRSLSNPALLAVIGWEEPVVIWSLFDPALRRRFEAALPLSFLRAHYKARVEDGLRRQDWNLTLKAEAARLASTSFPRKDMDVRQVSMAFGLKAPKLPGAKNLPQQERDTEYALVGSRVRENFIKADEGYVFSYFAMKTNFDPPGRWEVTEGGLLRDELRVRMESETQRGLHWYIDSAQVREEDITPSPTLMSDIVCLGALEV